MRPQGVHQFPKEEKYYETNEPGDSNHYPFPTAMPTAWRVPANTQLGSVFLGHEEGKITSSIPLPPSPNGHFITSPAKAHGFKRRAERGDIRRAPAGEVQVSQMRTGDYHSH